MFVFISHLTVPVEDCPALEEHFRDRAHLVDQFPGFLYLQLLRPAAGDATHAFLTAWRDRAAFRAYMASDAHAQSHAREPGEIMGRSSVRHEAFEVMMDSRLPTEWVAPQRAEALTMAGDLAAAPPPANARAASSGPQ